MKHIKRLSLLLALALCFGACATAEGITTMEARPEGATTLEAKPEGATTLEARAEGASTPETAAQKEDGPLTLPETVDPATLLAAHVSFTYGEPGTIIALEIATEEGTDEDTLGKLMQLEATATVDVSIDAVRYAATPAEDGKSMRVVLELEWSTDGNAQKMTDTLTLTPGEDGTLVVESETGGEAVPVIG